MSLPIDSPAIYDFEGATNSDFEQVIQFQDQNLATIDLTGYTLAMAIKDKPGGTTWLSLSSTSTTANGSGLTITTPTDGEFNITIKRADLAAFPFGSASGLSGAYDVVVTDAASVQRRFLKGQFVVELGVTV